MQTTQIKPRILVPRSSGATQIGAFQRAKKEDARILSNIEHDWLLAETDAIPFGDGALATWTGTMTAYALKEKRFGAEIKYQDPESKQIWRVPVPVGFRELRNSILVAEYPYYDLEVKEDNVTVIIPERKLAVVENFPCETGKWYNPDPKFGIPAGSPVDRADRARYLRRMGSRIGFVARGLSYDHFDYRRVVVSLDLPSVRLGVLAEDRRNGQRRTVAEKKALSRIGEMFKAAITRKKREPPHETGLRKGRDRRRT